MERTLKVYANTGHLFAEFEFSYDQPRQAKAHYKLFRRLYDDDEEDENKSVFELMGMDAYVDFRKFKSVDEIKAHDIDVVKKELGRDMTDPRGYNYVYDDQTVLIRYVVGGDHKLRFIGVINVTFNFIGNTKEVKFLSGENPRFDVDIATDSLETNIECISKIPVYRDRGEPMDISPYDLKKLPAWY